MNASRSIDGGAGTRAWRAVAAMVLILGVGGAGAQQSQSLEERLRAQLRSTTSQLQQVQNELSVLKAQRGAAPPPAAASPAELDSIQRALARAQQQLASERQGREARDNADRQLQQQARSAVDKAAAQLAQYRNAYEELLKLARTSETERQRLASDTATQRTAIASCEAKNAQLYAVGQEVVRAYETIDVTTVLAARQPFAARSRARFEEIAQQYGDKLYDGRFDARGVEAAEPSAVENQPAPDADAPK